MKPLDFIATVEAAYDRSLDDAAWLEQLLRCIGPALGTGDAPTTGYFYDLHRTKGATFRGLVSVGDTPYAAKDMEALLLSRVVGEAFVRDAGIDPYDSLGLRANITPTSGVLLTSFVPRGFRIRQRPLWNRLAAHIGAAGRLRRNQPAAVALLSPRGRLEHGNPATVAARADLANAAQSIDRARGKLRRLDPDAASALWRTMVNGEWSLVDWFDHDGKRFLLAQDNRVTTKPLRPLSPREHQVLAFAAMGHSNKLIAYDLGLAAGTIGVILSRAAKKLGVSSRLDLIRVYRESLE